MNKVFAVACLLGGMIVFNGCKTPGSKHSIVLGPQSDPTIRFEIPEQPQHRPEVPFAPPSERERIARLEVLQTAIFTAGRIAVEIIKQR